MFLWDGEGSGWLSGGLTGSICKWIGWKCLEHLSSKFIWGQDRDKMLLILKKEKAGALPAGRRWKASGGGKWNKACFLELPAVWQIAGREESVPGK